MTTVSLLRPRQHPVGRHPERTRDRILASALREFANKGFAGARVDVIARRARINKRMLYHYFGNKEGLFREVLRGKIQQRRSGAKPRAPAPRPRGQRAKNHEANFTTATQRHRDEALLLSRERLGFQFS